MAWAALAFVRRETGLVEWFGTPYPLLPFTAVVVCLLAAWIVYGSERLMCEELQLRTLPFALLAFLVFGTGLAAGFVVDAGTAPATRALLTAACGLGVALVTAYFSAFALRGDPLLPRRLAVDARRRDWARVGAALPVWLVSLGFAGVCALIARLAFANVHLPAPLDLWFRAPAGALPIFLYGGARHGGAVRARLHRARRPYRTRGVDLSRAGVLAAARHPDPRRRRGRLAAC